VGNVVNVPRLKRLRPDMVFVEDNCEGFLGKYGKHDDDETQHQYSGTSDATLCSSVSFYGNKIITTGEGGAFFTNDDAVYDHISRVYSQGMSSKRYVHEVHAYNYRMTNVQAAFLYDQLSDLDTIIAQKTKVFETYRTLLNEHDLIRSGRVRLFAKEDGTQSTHWIFALRIVGNPKNWPSNWGDERLAVIGGYIVGTKANLSNANLSGFDLTSYGSDLVGANLNGANLAGTKLAGTYLGGATDENTGGGTRTANVKGTPATLPDGARMVGTSIVAPSVNLDGANFSKMDLHDSDFSTMSFVGTNFNGANLKGVKFNKRNLTGADLTGADLTGADLTGAILTNAKIGSAKLGDATLTGIKTGGMTGTPASKPATLTLLGGFLLGPNVNLAGANLSKLKLTGLNLDGVNAEGATLTGVVSSGITGTMTLGAGRRVINGHIVGPGVDLSKLTDLNGQDFSDLDLTGANVGSTDLGAVTLTGATTGKLVGTPKTVTTGYKFVGGFILGPGIKLKGKDLSKLNLTGIDLTGVDLRNANLTGATLTGANITNADFGRQEGYYEPSVGYVSEAATLTGVISGGLVGTPAKTPEKWIIAGGFLAGPGANFTKADLSNVDLSIYYPQSGYRTADLTGINITGAIMATAKLPMVNGGWTKIVGTPKSLPTGIKLVKGVLSYS
jgi:uncharacterized protein YjbI with pentapeptide repeats